MPFSDELGGIVARIRLPETTPLGESLPPVSDTAPVSATLFIGSKTSVTFNYSGCGFVRGLSSAGNGHAAWDTPEYPHSTELRRQARSAHLVAASCYS